MRVAINCDSTTLEIIKIALPASLVVLGWYVVYSLQRSAHDAQETRKDLRARLDRLDADLVKLRDKCIEYYSDPTKGFELSTQIKVVSEDVRRQSLLLSSKFLTNLEKSKLTGCLINVLMSATGGKFESKTRVALKSSDPQLSNLFQYSAQLIVMFEDGFFKHYPPSRR
jgi:hypothetical protein